MFVLHNYDTNTYPKQKGAEEIMKIAVMYISKTGSTQLCAEYIASKLQDCSLFDLDREIPCLSDFDVLLIGSGVRMGKIYKPAKQVLNDNIPMQRRQGLKAGRDILNACDTIIIGARHGISEGMAAEINAAAGKHQIIVI